MAEINVLVIEDDEFKCNDIIKRLSKSLVIKKTHSVRTAVKTIYDNDFDLIILDMALPTFEKKEGKSIGSSQPQGGVEVLRTIQHLDKKCMVIIISQYPGLEIDGEFMSLKDAITPLRQRYSVNLIGAIEYDFTSNDWIEPFDKLLEIL